ncbi:MAG: hypothetical protein J6D87_04030 [Clostridia bacterium]|nr:hypothetical protein [Clostridia bacterium]
MKKTRYQACLLISELDDDMILEAELANVPMRRRVGHVMKRVWLIAACMTLLATAAILLLLPAMLREYPAPSPIPPLTSEPAVETPEPVVNWVSDPTLVRVERLSAPEAVADTDVTEDGNLVSVESQTQYFASQLILIHFSCREDEHVMVEPSSWRSALNPVYLYTAEASGITRSYWRFTDGELDEQASPSEELSYSRFKEAFGRSVTARNGDVILWQYADLALACVEDNFVDFTVVDDEGNVTGGGSIYIGGLDLTSMSGNKTYYGESLYGDSGGSFKNFCFTNAIYRPVVLGAYRYTNEGGGDEKIQAQRLKELHALASERRESMFADVSGELLRVSVREALADYAWVIGETGGWGLTSIGKYQNETKYLIMSFANSLDPADHEYLLFLYEGTYGRITSRETELTNEYGGMIAGRLYLEDGTVVQVDLRHADQPVTLLPPAETETA